MTDKCAQSAQQSNSFCAYYAHDRSSAAVHNRHMFDPDWFKRRKKELRLSDTAIGAAIGRDRSVANRIINGSLDFDMKHLDGLAKAFQVGKEELLFRFGVQIGRAHVELQSLMRISYAVFCLKKKQN